MKWWRQESMYMRRCLLEDLYIILLLCSDFSDFDVERLVSIGYRFFDFVTWSRFAASERAGLRDTHSIQLKLVSLGCG